MQLSKNSKVNSAVLGIYRLLIIFFFIFTLYFAQAIVIPLTLSALLTFLLSPLVTSLEKWIGRVFSILLIVIVSFSTIGFTGYIFIRQIVLFGSNFQNYYENIQAKLQAFHLPQWEIFNRLGQILASFKEELFGNSEAVDTYTKAVPMDVKLIDLSSGFANVAQWISGSIFNLLGTTGIVLLLVIFMLLNREDLRSRIIKLIGRGRISSATSTMDDASVRVYNYIFRQCIVNIGFGVCVSTGLYLIGVPNVILWGCFGAILRFIPYIGSWIAAIFPICLSFIITDTWSVPFLTISFFIVLEITTAYVIEPLYYGVGTGVSPFALILAAIFWTWLWGPIGLLLSTPLTVCLVVIGQHMTNMKFLSVLLSEEKALTPVEECYHRLLSFDSSASMEIVESYLKNNSLVSLYDSIFIPIVNQVEVDFNLELIDAEKKYGIYQNIREIVELLDADEQKETMKVSEPKLTVVCLPARTIRDEIGVDILSQVLSYNSFNVKNVKVNISSVFELVEKINPDAVCIVVVGPFVLSHIRYLCTQLHKRSSQKPTFIGLLGFSEVPSEILDKLNSLGLNKIVFSISQALESLQKLRSGNAIV